MCEQPTACAVRAMQWVQTDLWLDIAQDRLDRWIEQGIPPRISHHARDVRQLERAISFGDIKIAVENGQVIHRDLDTEAHQEHLLILAWLRTSPKKFRPVHVSLLLSDDGTDAFIKTVYDPRSYDWIWADNYTRRVCWCNGKNL